VTPIYMNIDRLQQIVTMVAHGSVSDQDVREITQQLIDAGVPGSARSSILRPASPA